VLCPHFQHLNSRCSSDCVCDDRSPNTCLGHRAAGFPLRSIHVAAIHEYEHARIRRHSGKRHQQRKFHRQHHAADVDQLRRSGGGAGHSVFRSQHTLRTRGLTQLVDVYRVSFDGYRQVLVLYLKRPSRAPRFPYLSSNGRLRYSTKSCRN